MNPIYKFSLVVSGVEKEVYPNYGTKDLSKEYFLEPNQRFFRAKLTGKLTFYGLDYEYIYSKPFDTIYSLKVYISHNNGQTWVEYVKGKFTRTDCEIDEDNKRCEVEPDIDDQYNKIVAGLEKEYDIMKLSPEIAPIVFQRRPLIQVYIPGQSVVSCFLAGSYWEEQADATFDIDKIVNDYHFALCNLLKEINVTVSGTPIAASGLYIGRMNTLDNGETFTGQLFRQDTDDYYMNVSQNIDTLTSTVTCIFELVRDSDSAIIFRAEEINPADNQDFTMGAYEGGSTGDALAEMATYPIYARYLTDVDKYLDVPTYDIAEDDLVGDNRSYSKVIGYTFDVAWISSNSSVEPTQWGRRDDGKYFLPPHSISGQPFFPIARSSWRYASIWFAYYLFDEYLEKEGRKTFEIKDNFPIHSVISVLLKEIDPTITHDATNDYSQFLYGSTNPITFNKYFLFITPKTNVTIGEYEVPAQKAPTMLMNILNMLRDTLKCWWFVDSGKLRIEHISFFRNGGSYSNTPVIGIDLTLEENVRNGKKWSYNTSKYKYDKIDLAERIQFAWMDKVTLPFEGFPIEVISNYVQAGKVDPVQVTQFTSDIDFMILNPTSINNDGFALFAAVEGDALIDSDAGTVGGGEAETGEYGDKKYRLKEPYIGKEGIFRADVYAASGATIKIVFFDSDGDMLQELPNIILSSGDNELDETVTIPAGAYSIGFKSVSGAIGYQVLYFDMPGTYELPFLNRTVEGVNYSLQNGLMSFTYLVPNYHKHDLPAKNVKINGVSTVATGILRKKKQSVTFPGLRSGNDPDYFKLVKTNIGTGWISKLNINLHSRMNKIDLEYDTE